MKKTSKSIPALAALSFVILCVATVTQAVAQSATIDNSGAVDSAATDTPLTHEAIEEDASSGMEQSLANTDDIMQKLNEQLPGIAFTAVSETSISGLYEVVADGQIYYVDESAEYLIDGNLIRLSDRANLTDARLGGIHMGLIDQMDEKDMLIYETADPSDSDRSITVFTDISCGYCRRLHAEIDTLLEEGVRVRYLLFPRAGLDSQGRRDLESVWCADNPQEAMTVAKSGGEIVAKTCENPIEKHVALAERLGLRGTPLIYTDSGEKIPGYREANDLVTLVNSSEPMVR